MRFLEKFPDHARVGLREEKRKAKGPEAIHVSYPKTKEEGKRKERRKLGRILGVS